MEAVVAQMEKGREPLSAAIKAASGQVRNKIGISSELLRVKDLLARRFFCNKLGRMDLHNGLASDKFQENFDALGTGHDLRNDRAQSLKCARGNFDGVARREFGVDDMHLGIPKLFLELPDLGVGNGRPFVAEMHHT